MKRRAEPRARSGVELPPGRSASALLHELLAEVCARFPQALAAAQFPERAADFRKRFPDILPRFEAARAASAQRSEIARFLFGASQAALRWCDAHGERPLADALADAIANARHRSAPAEAQSPAAQPAGDSRNPGAESARHASGGEAGARRLLPGVPFEGRSFRGAELRELGALLCERGLCTPAVAESLNWIAERAGREGLSLAGRRFAVLGAGAELAPTPLLLEAGAEVLWIDLAAPPHALRQMSAAGAGRLHWQAEAGDLLQQPLAIAAQLARFAKFGPLDIGLYAYAPGRGREWRLAGVMNALVNALPPEARRSASLLVSPTSPVLLEETALAAEAQRRATRPAWQALLESAGLLGSGGGHTQVANARVTRSVVALQGASYQAAQYLEKLLAAETWRAHGPPQAPAPFPVSANVAGITLTRSLSHPLFDAGFEGARAFGCLAFAPQTTRALCGLLSLHDLLDPAAAARLGPRHIHGGVFALPYPINPAIQTAALIGLARRPTLLTALLRRG